jgi:hypothetical protein
MVVDAVRACLSWAPELSCGGREGRPESRLGQSYARVCMSGRVQEYAHTRDAGHIRYTGRPCACTPDSELVAGFETAANEPEAAHRLGRREFHANRRSSDMMTGGPARGPTRR